MELVQDRTDPNTQGNCETDVLASHGDVSQVCEGDGEFPTIEHKQQGDDCLCDGISEPGTPPTPSTTRATPQIRHPVFPVASDFRPTPSKVESQPTDSGLSEVCSTLSPPSIQGKSVQQSAGGALPSRAPAYINELGGDSNNACGSTEPNFGSGSPKSERPNGVESGMLDRIPGYVHSQASACGSADWMSSKLHDVNAYESLPLKNPLFGIEKHQFTNPGTLEVDSAPNSPEMHQPSTSAVTEAFEKALRSIQSKTSNSVQTDLRSSPDSTQDVIPCRLGDESATLDSPISRCSSSSGNNLHRRESNKDASTDPQVGDANPEDLLPNVLDQLTQSTLDLRDIEPMVPPNALSPSVANQYTNASPHRRSSDIQLRSISSPVHKWTSLAHHEILDEVLAKIPDGCVSNEIPDPCETSSATSIMTSSQGDVGLTKDRATLREAIYGAWMDSPPAPPMSGAEMVKSLHGDLIVEDQDQHASCSEDALDTAHNMPE